MGALDTVGKQARSYLVMFMLTAPIQRTPTSQGLMMLSESIVSTLKNAHY